MLADEMYFISSASLPQPSPRSQLRSIERILCLQFTPDPQIIQFAFKARGEALGLIDRHRLETDAVVGPALRKKRQVDRDHVADPRIAAGCLMIGHQHDQLSVRQE